MLWLRLRLDDSPSFEALERQRAVARTPVRDAITGHWRSILKVAGMGLSITAPGFLGLAYLPVFLIGTKKLAATGVYIMTALVLIGAALLFPLFGLLAEQWGRRRTMIVGTVGIVLVAYPFMMVVDASSSIVLVGLAFFAFCIPHAMMSAPSYAMFTELFPARVRYTGAAVGWNIGVVIAGGLGPYLSAQFVAWSGNNLTPAFWVIAAGLVGLTAVSLVPETGDKPLAV